MSSACGLRLGACCLRLEAFFYFLKKAGACAIGGYNHIRPCVPYAQADFQESTIAPPSRENVAALTDPRSMLFTARLHVPYATNNMDQGSGAVARPKPSICIS